MGNARLCTCPRTTPRDLQDPASRRVLFYTLRVEVAAIGHFRHVKQERHSTRSALRAHKPALKSREREVRPTRPKRASACRAAPVARHLPCAYAACATRRSSANSSAVRAFAALSAARTAWLLEWAAASCSLAARISLATRSRLKVSMSRARRPRVIASRSAGASSAPRDRPDPQAAIRHTPTD
jgi:hypothetical protein